MTITIRREEVKDYSQIATVNYLAFHGWKPDNPFVKEGIMTDVLRQHSGFNPELALVAEIDNQIVGYALFLPFDFVVLGEEIKGMILGPAAVKPEYQKTGVGKKLIEAGHERAKALGIKISLCCGHPNYYPKFGYKNSMFALAGVYVSRSTKSMDISDYKLRNLEENDDALLTTLWRANHGDDELALCPGSGLSDWVNYSAQCDVKVVEKGDKVIGYIRYQWINGLEVKELIATERYFDTVLNVVCQIAKEKKVEKIKLLMSLEKAKRLIASEKAFVLEDCYFVNEAFMIKSIDEDFTVEAYMSKVEKAEIKAGVIALANVYDIEE